MHSSVAIGHLVFMLRPARAPPGLELYTHSGTLWGHSIPPGVAGRWILAALRCTTHAVRDALSTRRDRVRRFLDAARVLREPHHREGLAVRASLLATTGLSAENIELALRECFETDATDDQLVALCQSTPEAEAAHVLLSANVFVASLRAIAIAVASSSRVFVRASRREPTMVEYLGRLCRGAFTQTDRLTPSAGDHAWLYGHDRTLAEVQSELEPGVVVHAHGSGFGVVVLGQDCSDRASVAKAVAHDVALFDQRGCLSPRLVFVVGTAKDALAWAEALAFALEVTERSIPRGVLVSEELAAITRYRDTMAYAGTLLAAGSSWVGVETTGACPLLPPTGRVLHVCCVQNLAQALGPLGKSITAVGVASSHTDATSGNGSSTARARLAMQHELSALLPRARLVEVGMMQRPPLDGPVDRRGD